MVVKADGFNPKLCVHSHHFDVCIFVLFFTLILYRPPICCPHLPPSAKQWTESIQMKTKRKQKKRKKAEKEERKEWNSSQHTNPHQSYTLNNIQYASYGICLSIICREYEKAHMVISAFNTSTLDTQFKHTRHAARNVLFFCTSTVRERERDFEFGEAKMNTRVGKGSKYYIILCVEPNSHTARTHFSRSCEQTYTHAYWENKYAEYVLIKYITHS